MTSNRSSRRQRGSASTWVFVGFAAVGLFFLLTEHRAHLLGWWPFLLLAACPLMHLFHGGHGGHGGHEPENTPRRRDETDPPAKPAATRNAADVPPSAHHHH